MWFYAQHDSFILASSTLLPADENSSRYNAGWEPFLKRTEWLSFLCRRTHETEIAVLIPCYNEELTVGQVIRDFRKQLPERGYLCVR